jgi:hypothetical protein
MSLIPSDYKGVESVSIEGEKILVEEYDLDPLRTIELAIRDTLTGIESRRQAETDALILGQNYPNPLWMDCRERETTGLELRASNRKRK